MFGSNGPCSPGDDYLPPYSHILEPIYFPNCTPDYRPPLQTPDSDPDYNSSSAPPTPDVISGLVSLSGGPCLSEMSSGSFGDVTSPEEGGCSSTSPPAYSLDVSRVQATRSKLIKEGLKLTIQSRRMINGLDNARSEYHQPLPEELTHEDEERRRRRRERNKVAATKCRNKKKERTGRLAEESETLEVNNNALKNEINSLESEKNELLGLLQGHLPHCGLQPRNTCSQPQRSARYQPTWSSVLG